MTIQEFACDFPYANIEKLQQSLLWLHLVKSVQSHWCEISRLGVDNNCLFSHFSKTASLYVVCFKLKQQSLREVFSVVWVIEVIRDVMLGWSRWRCYAMH